MSVFGLSPLFSQSKKAIKYQRKIEKRLLDWQYPDEVSAVASKIEIDTFSINPDLQQITVHLSKALSYLPIREENYHQTMQSIHEVIGRKFREYKIQLITDGKLLESYIPNIYRKTFQIDTERFSSLENERIPLVRKLHKEVPSEGLYNRNIALWNSHGMYYESKLDRWEWQRARLFSTVEDLFPTTFVLPYLVPMLENAGANTFLPRERDIQIHEVIVDNDRSSDSSKFIVSGLEPEIIDEAGFLMQDTIFGNVNPFLMGSHIRFKSTSSPGSYLDYLPFFKESGDYAVYVSYQQSDENISDAKYVVSHTGGQTEFIVNQKMGGGTWIYLGTFHFQEGMDSIIGAVRLDGFSHQSGWISADAVRFGGGIGNVARKPANADSTEIQWKVSNKPRYQEGARYYLQYAGVPDTSVYYLNKGENDYSDDYQSRGEWVNYLMGAPNGPNLDRNTTGLNIPIDLSLAFHTDAGVTPKDSIIGTLMIYSSDRDDGKYPNGQSKMVNRDFADFLQSEIIHDIRRQVNPEWSRRAMWDKQYFEAWRPNVPSVLLELLSHQNLADMKFGQDPRFKFIVSRAIYKGIVKFLAYQEHTDYMIQPLPIDHFSMLKTGDKSIRLSWKPRLDSLEPTAIPTKYKVYQRIGYGGFDNGRIVTTEFLEMELPEFGTIYSFKITAINEGGESFPSEILSVGFLDKPSEPVLVVNGFDRVTAPSIIDNGDFAGLALWDDEGVADKYNIGYTGRQYDYDRKSHWLDDDSPGWGASYGDMEGKPIPGNSFDNTFIHGTAILEAGYSFISTSDEAFSDNSFELKSIQNIDLIFGEEKSTTTFGGTQFKVFDTAMQKKVSEFTARGGNVFVSGAYIGSDHILSADTIAQAFTNNVLHFKWRTNHAVKSGGVLTTDYAHEYFNGHWSFNTTYDPKIYKVEAPDGLEPIGENAIAAFRYEENNTGAGIIYQGKYKTVALGFPFETIIDPKEKVYLMKQILGFFK